jgi:hypothetical protein
MENDTATVVERIQRAAARIIATHPAGHQLCLIGGYRYRLLNASARASIDIDYHWEGDLQRKQIEIVELLRGKLPPEVTRELGYDGDIRPAAGPEAESPAARIVEMAFYRVQDAGSRIEIPVEITSVARHDAPIVKTIAGTVFLTISDGDMIESKILACLNRPFFQARDILDIFLFQDTLPPDAPGRLSKKLKQLGLRLDAAIEKLDTLEKSRTVHVRAIDRLLAEQVNPAVSANLLAAGGAVMVWDAVMRLLREILVKAKEFSA